MKTIKRILISLAVFWLVCYAAMILLIGVIFPLSLPAGDLSTRPMVNPVNAVAMVSGTSNITLAAPAVRQSEPADLFTRSLLPASLATVFAGLALACGIQIFRIFGRRHYRY